MFANNLLRSQNLLKTELCGKPAVGRSVSANLLPSLQEANWSPLEEPLFAHIGRFASDVFSACIRFSLTFHAPFTSGRRCGDFIIKFIRPRVVRVFYSVASFFYARINLITTHFVVVRPVSLLLPVPTNPRHSITDYHLQRRCTRQ